MSNSDQYMGVFLAEMEEQLELLNQSVLALEKSDQDPEILKSIFRVAHTLKGSSSTMGFEMIAELTHRMENILSDVRAEKLRVSGALVDTLFACLDQLQTWRDIVAGGAEEEMEPATDLISRIENIRAGGNPDGSEAAEKSLPELIISPQILELSSSYLQQGWVIGAIGVQIDQACIMKGVRAYLAYNKAKEIGEVLASSPEIQELSEGDYQGNILLWAAAPNAGDLEKVRSAILDIPEIIEVTIDPWSESDTVFSLPVSIEDQGSSQAVENEAHSEETVGGSGNLAAVKRPKEGNKSEAEPKTTESSEYLRIEVGKLDVLMNLLGELVIDRARLTQIESELENKYGGEVTEALSEVSRHISLVTGELQERLLKLRMSPMSVVFGRFPRIVRDLSRQLGKEVNLELEGEETELDRAVIQNIFEPLIHLIRNAIDHGLEAPEARVQAGKAACGELLIKAEQLGGEILITVQDDGKGIQPEVIRQVAVERGLVTSQEAKAVKDSDVIQWIFEPGFSTKQEVSEVSGRGVGMDIVRHRVEEMHGRIKVDSVVGTGTTFSVTLPLTLAVVRALLVQVGDDAYTLPLSNIVETLRVPEQEIIKLGSNPAVVVRGRTIPVIDLLEWCETGSEPDEDGYISIVLVTTGIHQAGLIVSGFIGEQEVVVKPLDNYLGRIKGFGGATLLGDGRVSLIFDVPGLLKGIDVWTKQTG